VAFPVSDHCDGARFFNRHAAAGRDFRDVFTWMRTRQRTAWPRALSLAPQPPPPTTVPPGQVAVTFIGHSTFLIRTATRVFITDPVFTTHAGPFGRLGPRRVRPPALALADLPPIDVVLLSHCHYDHLQPSCIAAIGCDLVTTLGVSRYIPAARGGRGPRHIVELDWWDTTRLSGATITAVPAQHFAARTPWDKNQTLWCGFVVQIDGVTLYFAGDSGYSPQFAEIGARFPSIDVALIPIGAYEPRWFMQPMHMNPDEAVRVHRELGARRSIGMHFGTFQLTDEGIDEPVAALARARDEQGVSAEAFRVLGFGETCVLAATRDGVTR
jgi:L-ascorbate metabolism protein UlaG (beta-lactamase superfamily)